MTLSIKNRMRWSFLLLVFLCKTSSYGLLRQADQEPNNSDSVQVRLVGEATVTDIIAISKHPNVTLVLKKDGTVWGWGKNDYGQLGVRTTSEKVPLPVETSTGPLQDVASIECNGRTTVATRHDGTIWKSSDDFLIAPWLKRIDREREQQIGSGDSNKEQNKKNHLLQQQTESQVGLPLLSSTPNIFLEEELWEAALASPEEPFAISVLATGPYQAPANIGLVVNVTHPANTTITKVEFYNKETLLGTITDPPYEFAYKDAPQGTYRIEARAYDVEGNITGATTEFEVAPPNRYNRGFGTDQRYLSSIIALDFEKGIFLDGISDFSIPFPSTIYPTYPWFLRTASDPNESCYHIYHNESDAISYRSVNTLPTINGSPVGGQPPCVAFGVQGGGSPLYINQNYHFGIAAGGENFSLTNNPDIKIEVYESSFFEKGAIQVAPVFTQTYSLPRSGDTLAKFNNNGGVVDYHLLTNYNGKEIDFDTQIQYPKAFSPHDQWGMIPAYALAITHRARNNLFYYKVNIMGVTINNGTPFDMAKNEQHSAPAYNISYSLDFSEPLPWQISLINLPHFQGVPLPSVYQGKGVDELIHQSPAIRDALTTPEQLGLNLLDVNNSPELKSHSVLDKLVADYNNDPLALANYVLNEIELTDAIGYNTANTISDVSINPQGVSRDALGTYLEGEGSPIEQCGLLIYLLRKVGVPAAYVFPAHNQTLMFDEQLSKLLRVQLRGAVDDLGNQKYPELIPINYPWVAAYIDGKWVHLFPWLKDTEVREGRDLWSYFPNGYQTETQWLMHYLLNDPNIRGLSQEDNPGTLFPLYAEAQLNQAGLGLEDVGMHYVNRPHYYNSWDDFPRPWQTPLISNNELAENLDAAQNPNLAAILTNIFDTISIQITSTTPNSNLLLETGPMRFADLHNRRLLLYHQLIPGSNPAQFKMILSLEPYDNAAPSDCAQTYTFNKGNNPDPAGALFRSAQQQSFVLTDNDNVFNYKISYSRQQQAGTVDLERDYAAQFPGIANRTSNELVRPIAKGEMACLSLSYGRVTDKMLDFEAKKYWDYQEEVAANSGNIDAERGIGQLLQLMGQNYYYNLSQFKSFIEPLTKKKAISYLGQGLVKLTPERNYNRSLKIINSNDINDLNLGYPIVDMAVQRATYLRNNTSHLDSGAIAQDIEILFTVDNSANEHRVINKFFEQENAVSTIRLLDIAQGWTPETGVAAHPGEGVVILSQANATSESTNSYSSAPGTFIFPPGLHQIITIPSLTTSLGGWMQASGFLDSINGALQNPLNTIILTPAPVKTAEKNGDPYIGMGALILGTDGIGALISRKMLLTFDQNFNYIIANSNQNPLFGNLKNSLLCDNTTFFHGGSGELLRAPIYPGHSTSTWLSQCSLTKNSYNGYTLNFLNKDQPLITSNPKDASNLEKGTEALSSDAVDRLGEWNQNSLNGNTSTIQNSGSDVAAILRKEKNLGNTGKNSYYGKLLALNFVKDPVSVVTGEFYINA
ncbi:MAG: hypothetical protein K2W99_01050, partial [Chthoniobacterales bacterium]|nr:hypothetical protein [Chthoniobacterales bacterium]